MKCELKLIRYRLLGISLSKIVYWALLGVSIGVMINIFLHEHIPIIRDIVNIVFFIMVLLLYVVTRVECKRMTQAGDE